MNEREIQQAANGGAATEIVTVQREREDDPLAIIEARNKLLDRIIGAAIQATHPGQWMNIGDKPYPTGPACEAMARRCAVGMDSLSREKIQSYDDAGEFYIWVYRARFYLPGGQDGSRDVVWAEGTCSSRDSFLGTETSSGRLLSDCDEGSIMKASLTNCRNNGITQLLGVRNMSWDRLEQYGIKRDATGRVEYDAGAKGGGRGKSTDDVDLKFGRGKDKKLSEVSDDDVRWYVGCWQKDLDDPAKSKFHKTSRKNIDIANALLAARANAAAGVQTNGAATPSVWGRIKALPEAHGLDDATLGSVVKNATGKANAKDLAEADIPKAQAALAEWKQGEKDIEF